MSSTRNPKSQPPGADKSKSKEENSEEPKGPNQQVNKSETSTNDKLEDKLEEGYYVVQKKLNVQKETEGSSPAEDVTDYYMVISDAQEEDEGETFSYMVQWDCYSQQEAGYFPFKKDHDLYVGKKKSIDTQRKKPNVKDKHKDKHKVYYMKKMKATDIQQKGILSIITDNTNKIYHTRRKEGSCRKRKIGDGQNSFLLKLTKEEITKERRTHISSSLGETNHNLICVYQMVEMECTDPERKDILNRIADIRRSVLDIMKPIVELLKKAIVGLVGLLKKAIVGLFGLLKKAIVGLFGLLKKAFVGLLKGDVVGNFMIFIFTFLIILVMIGAAILIIWSKEKDENKSCEIDEALQLLQVNFSVPCKYDNVKTYLENSFSISMASLSFDVFWLIFGLILKMIFPERQKRACLAVYVIGIFLSGLCFGILFLQTKDDVVDSKTQLTDIDYGEIKTFMMKSLEQHYTSDVITNNDTMSDRWNNFFIKYDCCAVNQVRSTTNDFDTTPWCTTSGSCQQTNSQIPKSCCKDVTEDDYVNADNSCHATVSSGTYKDSCFAQVKKFDDEAMTENDVDVLSVILGTIGILKVASVVSLFVICVFQIIWDKFHAKKDDACKPESSSSGACLQDVAQV